MKQPRTSGSGQRTGPTLSMLPRTPCSRAMWVGTSYFNVCHFSNMQHCCSLFFHRHILPTGWVQVRQRDPEGLRDTCGRWQVNLTVHEECWNGQWGKFPHSLLETPYLVKTTKGQIVMLKNVMFNVLNCFFFSFAHPRWNINRSMRRKRDTTCLSWTLLKFSMPRLCVFWPQR